MTALATLDTQAASQPQSAVSPGVLHPLPAFLFSARGKLPITVMDFTQEGVIAKGAKQPPRDSYALLVRNGVKVPAIVSWIEDERFRLDFEEPLVDMRKQAAFRGKGAMAMEIH